jgi:hypothetical protein
MSLRVKKLDALLVPNYIGTSIDNGSLLKRYGSFSPLFTRYNTDRLSQFAGSETHVFRATGSLEFNAFGQSTVIGTRPVTKTDS